MILEDWQYQTLRARAEREHRSISDLIREILRKALVPSPRRNSRIKAIEGIGEDGSAYGKAHDHILYGGKSED